jgi:5-formyltetrahydrofolate cyclo-ligase
VTAAEAKARLRRAALARRDGAALAAPDAAARIAGHAPGLPRPRLVSAYVAMRSELDPMPLARALAGPAARLALPAIERRRMLFRGFSPGDPLLPGPFGTREPAGEEVVPDLLLVPLLAFTRAGDRLGYGAGYYDGWLAAHPSALAVGVAYAAQEVPALPVEPHDRRLDAILTERERIAVAGGRLAHLA